MAKTKVALIAGIVFLVIGISSGLFCGYKLYNDGGTTNGITATNIQLAAKLVIANNRIKQLESQSKIDAGTISQLRTDSESIAASRDKFKSAYNRLADLIKQQGSSVDTIAGGNDGDTKSLQRLNEIITGLAKTN